MDNRIKFKEFVDLLLARIYDYEVQHGAGKFFDLNYIAIEFSSQPPQQWVFDATKVLERRGFIRAIYSMGGGCEAMLTGDGRIFVEEERTQTIKEYRENPNVYVVIHGNSNQVNVAGGQQSNVSQTMTIESQRKPAFNVIDEIKDLLENDNTVSDQEKKDLLIDLETVGKQLKKREPNKHVMASALESINKITSLSGSLAKLIDLLNF